jgi:hypothetical protein
MIAGSRGRLQDDLADWRRDQSVTGSMGESQWSG